MNPDFQWLIENAPHTFVESRRKWLAEHLAKIEADYWRDWAKRERRRQRLIAFHDHMSAA